MCVCVHTPLLEENYSFKGNKKTKKKKGEVGKLFKGIGNKLPCVAAICTELFSCFFFFFKFWACEAFQPAWFHKEK